MELTKQKKQQLILFSTLMVLMICYIGWVFYISEPQYIDNSNKSLERYDYVSIPKYTFSWSSDQEVKNGIVIQVDNTSALVKTREYRDEYYELDLKKSKYRIIGKGTIYHKVNHYVGFNIMIITQFLIMIVLSVIGFTVITTLFKLFQD